MATRDPSLVRADTWDVTVQKRAVTTEHSSLQLWFRVASSADVPVAVRIADSVPAHIDGSDVGFHTGCAGTDWSYLDGRVWFTPTLETGEQVETVFAVRDPDEETVSSLTDSPTIEAVQPLE